MTDPAVSIVTPTLNCARTIGAAIDSVRRQTHDVAVEHIVVDGGSTDGTREIVSSRAGAVLVAGGEGNLYDALNKGIALARGRVIGLLNGDDAYRPGALAAALAAFSERPRAKIVCGRAEIADPHGQVTAVHVPPAGARLDPLDLVRGVPIINARFFRREAFAEIGAFDIRYSVAADLDWLLRAAASGMEVSTIPQALYRYTQHPGSISMNGWISCTRIANDHMAIAEDRVGDGSRSHPTPPWLSELHAHGALLGLVAGLARGDWHAAWGCSARGMAFSGAWPLRALAIGGSWISRRILGNIKSVQ